MKLIDQFFGKLWRAVVLLLALALPLAGLQARASRAPADITNPVWGRKPVLHYFMFTGDLARILQREVGLSDAQFESVKQAAQVETDRLRSLDEVSRAILGDETLKAAEQRQQIALSGYNQQVEMAVQDTRQALENALDANSYAKLVEWIEARWIKERALHGAPAAPNAARTYSVYATRYDSGGVYTVALPDKCLKLANGGNSICNDSGYDTGQNYSVQLHYQDTVTVRVRESGPWNADDNFWSGLSDPQPRRLFPDLPAGMPEAQAAYFDDYNNGRDQFDRIVTAPFGIDLARQVSIDIGLQPGINDWIDVTFLWTDNWNDAQVDAVTLFKPSTLTPAYTGDMCVTAWHRINGYGDYAYLTLNVNSAGQSTNSGEWKPNIPVAGRYEVWAFIPDHASIQWLCPSQLVERDSADARYTITYSGGQRTVSRNQGPLSNMWTNLGTYEFSAGRNGKVSLTDLNGESNLSHTVAFSGMQFRRVMPPTPNPTPTFTPTPTPTLTPTPTASPTPTPAPFGYTGVGVLQSGESITLPLGLRYLQPPGVGGVGLDLTYDPALVSLQGCTADPQGAFDSGNCTPDTVLSDTLHLSLSDGTGVSGDPLLALLSFQAVGPPGTYTWLDIQVTSLFNPLGTPLAIPFHPGAICILPCWQVIFFPMVGR